MANKNPVEARLEKRAKNRKNRQGIDLQELRVIMSDFIEALDSHISSQEGVVSVQALKDIGYLLNQAVGSYVKLVEVGELEARTKKVEARIDELAESVRESRITA